MSLQQMAWRNVKRLNRQHDRKFVAVAAHHNHGKIAIDLEGNTWWIAGDEIEPDPSASTTTAQYIKTGGTYSLSDEWRAEIDRRRAELAGTDGSGQGAMG